MSTREIIRLVAGREFADRIRNKGFVLGTAVKVALAFALVGLLVLALVF